jgi:integrase
MTIPTLPDDGDLIDLYLLHIVGQRSPETIRTYATALRRAHAQLPYGLPGASLDELEAWLWQPGWKPATRSTYRGALREFFAWAYRGGELDQNTAADLPRVKRGRRIPRPTSDQQTRLILTAAAEPVRLWSTIAAYAGARCCEIARLDRGDVTEHTVRLWGKGDHERLVPTHPALWAAVRDLPAGRVAGGATARDVSRLCSAEYRRLGMAGPPPVTAHRLRHWAATVWLAAIGDLRVVQELLGHASPATTAGYAMPSPAAMRAAVAGAPVW